MYHQGGEKQRSRASSLFALLLLPLRVHPHLTRLGFPHSQCNAAFVHLCASEQALLLLHKHGFTFFLIVLFLNLLTALREAS